MDSRRLIIANGVTVDLSEYLLKSEAETLYATLDGLNNKQDKLVSGTNIKTINGTSILGSGDIEISGGGSSDANVQAVDTGDVLDDVNVDYATTTYVDGLVGDINSVLESINGGASGGSSTGGSGAYSEVNHGTSDTTFTLTPNTFHIWNEVASLTLDLGSETSGVANEYLFQFTSGATATSLTLPDDIKWANEVTIEPNKIYQVSILKGLGSVLEFDNAPKLNLIENHITYDEGSFMDGGTITFEYPTASGLMFAMDRYENSVLVVPQGSTQLNIDWLEPIPPSIISFSPTEDSTYKYIL